jgi:antitoxin component YwqK of YwqJK toxin-antitoxin module
MRTIVLFCVFLAIISGCGSYDVEYYPSGMVKGKCEMKGGVRHGMCQEFFEDGTLMKCFSYENGVFNGVGQVYYENAILRWEAEYQNNLIHGFFREYSKSGVLIIDGTYSFDKAHGRFRFYNGDSGHLEKEVDYAYGEENGWYRSFYKNGKIQIKAIRKDGKETVFYQSYDDQGKLLDEVYTYSIDLNQDTIDYGGTVVGRVINSDSLVKSAMIGLTVRPTTVPSDITKMSLKMSDSTNFKLQDVTQRGNLYVWVMVESDSLTYEHIQYKKIYVTDTGYGYFP